jgi:hypothetical protein
MEADLLQFYVDRHVHEFRSRKKLRCNDLEIESSFVELLIMFIVFSYFCVSIILCITVAITSSWFSSLWSVNNSIKENLQIFSVLRTMYID